MTGNPQRLQYIDSLRGIAILMVIMHHSHPYFASVSNYTLPPVADTILQNGDKGVTLFFVMSAFTLCLSMSSKNKTESSPLRNYFMRRVFRIAPLYILVIGIVLLIGINAPSISSVLANLFFVHGLNASWINSTVPGGWSVGIEVLFYVIFPLLFFRIKQLHQAINLTLVCILIAKLVTGFMFKHPMISDGVLWGVYTYENIVSQLPVFLIGIVLFHLQQIKQEYINRRQLAYSCYFAAAFMLIHLLGGNIFKPHYLFAIAMAIAAYALAHVPVKLLVNRVTLWIGRVSYSLYLMHLLVANLLVKYHLNMYSTNPLADVTARFCIILAISAPLAYLTYRLIELPSQRFGKQLITRLDTRPQL